MSEDEIATIKDVMAAVKDVLSICTEVVARVRDVAHMLGNMHNVQNLYVEQELKLLTDPVWIVRYLVMLLEDAPQGAIPQERLLEALKRLDTARALMEARLA